MPRDEPAGIDPQLREVFARAIELAGPAKSRFLDAACDGDDRLRAAVEDLLDCHADPLPILGEAASRAEPGAGRRHPERIGPYRVLGVLGSGGMGVVYRAEQQQPRRHVALKVLQPGLVRDEMLKRFAQEAEVLGLLEHPGIARIYDAGTCDFGFGEMPYFAMELVDGQPLTTHANTRGLDLRARLGLAARICDAVQHAHERGVIHRDLKPGNVLVVDAATASEISAPEPQPKILDFGIARTTDTDLQLSTLQTGTGQLLGTLPYMSPEQVAGNHGALDARSDVYSIGVILYELLAGRVPIDFAGAGLTDVSRLVHDVEPTLLGRIDRSLRGDVETICDRALAKEPDRRYGSAAELADDLRRFLRSEPILARPQTAWYQVVRFARRHRAIVVGAVTTLVALIAGLIATVIYAVKADAAAAGERQRSAQLARALYRSQMHLCGEALRIGGGRERVRGLLGESMRARTGDRPGYVGWEWDLLHAHAHAAELRVDGLRGVIGWRADAGLLVCGEALELLDPATGELRPGPIDAKLRVDLAGVSRDWRRIVVPGKGTMAVFRDGEQLWRTTRRGGPCPVLGPDGRVMAICSYRRSAGDYFVRIVDVDTGEERTTLLGGRCIGAIAAFSHDGGLLAVGAKDSDSIRMFSTESWQQVRVLRRHPGLMGLSFHPAGRALASCGRDRMVRLWNPLTGELHRELAGHRQMVAVVAWHPDGERLVSGSQDGSIRLWDTATGHARVLGTHSGQLHSFAFDPAGERLASVDATGELRIWNVDATPAVRTLLPPSAKTRFSPPLRWHPDSERLAVGAGRVSFILDARNGAVLEEIPGQRVAFRRDGAQLAYRRGKKVIVQAVGETPTLHAHEFERDIGPLAWSPAGAATLAVGQHDQVCFWRPGEPPASVHTGAISHFFWRGDGTGLTVATWSTRIVEADPRTLAMRVVGHLFRVNAAAWEPGGTRVACGFLDDSVSIYDGTSRAPAAAESRGPRNPGSWVELHRLEGHADQLLSVAWSPDGERLATGSRDCSIRIWDARDGVEVIALHHDAEVRALAWSPDGAALASLSADGCLRIWDAGARD